MINWARTPLLDEELSVREYCGEREQGRIVLLERQDWWGQRQLTGSSFRRDQRRWVPGGGIAEL